MQSRGLLMIEHRLIERMISLVKASIQRITVLRTVDPHFIDVVVDFVRTYADRTHHGKEEDILFRAMETRPLSPNDRRVMEELIQEHVYGRQKTRALVEANIRYRNGDRDAIRDISSALQELTAFYPRHIEKEDKVFFPAAQAYFTDAEDQSLLVAYQEFDRTMIHEKYTAVVKSIEQAREAPNQAL